jgi:hypothetical protein
LPLALVAVCWTAISVVVGELYQSAIAYAVVSGVIFIIILIGGVIILRRSGLQDEEDEELDPMITGERKGMGYAALQIVGGIVAGPFVLYNAILKFLDKLAKINPEIPPESSTAIEESPAAEKKPARAKQSGAD